LTTLQASAWRNAAARLLRPHTCLDPMRREFKSELEPNEVVEPDLLDIRRSDVLLVEYGIPNRPYLGTTAEMMYAKMLGKPIVVFYGVHREISTHPWMQYLATKQLETLPEACRWIKEMLP